MNCEENLIFCCWFKTLQVSSNKNYKWDWLFERIIFTLLTLESLNMYDCSKLPNWLYGPENNTGTAMIWCHYEKQSGERERGKERGPT